MDSPADALVPERRQRSDRRSRATTRHKPVLRVIPPRTPDTEIDPTDLKNPALYINRELSWLEFNQRVLVQALDAAHPLIERVKFLSIVGSNLDEFFMIRVATTLKKLREGIEDVAPDGYNTEQQLDAMRSRARKQIDDQAACWDDLRRLLAAEKITFLEPEQWTPQIRE
jgi:polyphosphate kinase